MERSRTRLNMQIREAIHVIGTTLLCFLLLLAKTAVTPPSQFLLQSLQKDAAL